MTVFTILQNFIAIRQKEPCSRRKYVDFQKMLSDPCLNMTECHPPLSPTVLNNLHSTEAIPHSTETIPPSTNVMPPMY